MIDLLTIEDVNSCFINAFEKHEIYVLDTGLIKKPAPYTDVEYDFVKVSKEHIGTSGYKYSFKINNYAWCGDYFFLKSNGGYLSSTGDYNNGVLTFRTSQDNIKLCLYLSPIKKQVNGFNLTNLFWIPLDFEDITTQKQKVRFKHLQAKILLHLVSQSYTTPLIHESGSDITTIRVNTAQQYIGVKLASDNDYVFYYPINLPKRDVYINADQSTLKPGQVNILTFNHNDNLRIATIKFYNNGLELDSFRESTYPYKYNVFLDLTDVKSFDEIIITAKVLVSDEVKSKTVDFVFKQEYTEVSNYTELVNALDEGNLYIRLVDDISFDDSVLINYNVNIDGQNHTFNLNGHHFILNEGVGVIIENCQVYEGENAIIQRRNTKLTIENTQFINNITDSIGSCILCDIDLDNLNENDDFTTIIKNSRFTNNKSAILHAGELQIINCEYLNNDMSYTDKHYPALLYQSNGEAYIRNSTFDIDYADDNTYCVSEKSIGEAQALIHLGEDARINSADIITLKDTGLPFFDAPYSNRSHVFCKYYYPKIEACAYTSPLEALESKCVCYSVSNDNWIYKQNAKVTRADTHEENTVRSL